MEKNELLDERGNIISSKKKMCTKCGADNPQIHVDAFGQKVDFCNYDCLKAWVDAPSEILDAMAGRAGTKKTLSPAAYPGSEEIPPAPEWAIVGAVGAALLPYLIKRLTK